MQILHVKKEDMSGEKGCLVKLRNILINVDFLTNNIVTVVNVPCAFLLCFRKYTMQISVNITAVYDHIKLGNLVSETTDVSSWKP